MNNDTDNANSTIRCWCCRSLKRTNQNKIECNINIKSKTLIRKHIYDYIVSLVRSRGPKRERERESHPSNPTFLPWEKKRKIANTRTLQRERERKAKKVCFQHLRRLAKTQKNQIREEELNYLYYYHYLSSYLGL